MNAGMCRRGSGPLTCSRCVRLTSPNICSRGGEMLLFDASERFHYVDMVLAERPQGVLLGDFLAGVCDRERASLVALRKEFCRMAAWLLRTPLVHGALKPANIIVMPGGAIRLVNYEAMCVPQMDDYAEHAADDRGHWPTWRWD
ncbi:MAG: hypothetical protein ACLR8Y_16610 [Alistipes indistinctus]